MNHHNEDRWHHTGSGIAIGAGFGVALGLVLMNVLDHPGFFAVGIGIGITLGVTIGLALDQEKGDDHDRD